MESSPASPDRAGNWLAVTDTAVFVHRGAEELVAVNAAAEGLCGEAGSATDWAFSTRFHDPVTRAVLPASPIRKLLDRGDGGGVLVAGCIAGGLDERLLRCHAAVARGGESVLSITDVTRVWRAAGAAAAEARQAQALRYAHDLGNLVGAVRLAADTATLGDSVERMARSLDSIRRACARGEAIAEELASGFDPDAGAEYPSLAGLRVLASEAPASGDDLAFEALKLAGASVIVAGDDPEAALAAEADVLVAPAGAADLIAGARRRRVPAVTVVSRTPERRPEGGVDIETPLDPLRLVNTIRLLVPRAP